MKKYSLPILFLLHSGKWKPWMFYRKQMSFSPAFSDSASNLVSESDSGYLKSWPDISATEYFMILFENPHPPGYKVSVVNKTCDQKYIWGKKDFFRSELALFHFWCLWLVRCSCHKKCPQWSHKSICLSSRKNCLCFLSQNDKTHLKLSWNKDSSEWGQRVFVWAGGDTMMTAVISEITRRLEILRACG